VIVSLRVNVLPEHVRSHVERGGVRCCSWSLACQVRRNLGASRWHDWIGIRKSEDKTDLRRSRSLAPTRSFPLPSSSTIQDPLCRLFPGPRFGLFFYVSCHPLRHSHSRIQSPILFFSSTDAILLQAMLTLITLGGRRLTHVVITLRTRTNPPPLLRPCFSQPYCCCFKTLYLSFTQTPYIPFCRVTVLVPHTSLLSSYLPLLPALSGEGEHGRRGRRVLLMYGLEIALAKSINSCSYLGCERVNFGECCVAN
jgi:hypothetical protein